MILGMGTDIAQCSRFSQWLSSGIVKRFFHPDEHRYLEGLSTGIEQAIAARFAAKEALVKALGRGFRGLSLRDMEVYSLSSGQPMLRLWNNAKSVLDDLGPCKIWLSMSHEKEYAVATVILEKEIEYGCSR